MILYAKMLTLGIMIAICLKLTIQFAKFLI